MQTNPANVTFVEDTEHVSYDFDRDMLYAPYLGKTLRERCSRLFERRMSLEHEVAVMRALLVDALEMYSRTVDNLDLDPNITPTQRLSIISAASDFIALHLNRIKDLASAAHKLQGDPNLMVDPSLLQRTIFNVVKVIDVEIARDAPSFLRAGVDPRQLVQRIVNQLDTVIDVGSPDASSLTTSLYPADLEAQAMDATVPKTA